MQVSAEFTSKGKLLIYPLLEFYDISITIIQLYYKYCKNKSRIEMPIKKMNSNTDTL